MPTVRSHSSRVISKGNGDRQADVEAVLGELQRLSSKKVRAEMETRYGIITDKAYGVMMRDMQHVAKSIGTDHEFAQALWDTGWYEARMVACMVADPAQVTVVEMDAWCKDFDNWGICDTVCFKLWDRVPHAMGRVAKWAKSEDEFVKRAAYALLACLALHNKDIDRKVFLAQLPLIERAAKDDRNFVKKGVSWALRGIGGRDPECREAALELAHSLATSEHPAQRWVGKDVLRDLSRPLAMRRAAGNKSTRKLLPKG